MNHQDSRSTGPRTTEGKFRSSQNALKHGFTARDIVVPDDLADDFAQLESDLLGEFKPGSVTEMQYFRQLLRASWNLFRIDIEETRLFLDEGIDVMLTDKHAVLQRYRRQQERSRSEALKELRKLQTERVVRCLPTFHCFHDQAVSLDTRQIVRFAERLAKLRIESHAPASEGEQREELEAA